MPNQSDSKKKGLGKWTPYVIAGAGAVALVALLGNRGGGSSGPDTSGLAAEQAAQLIQAEAEKRAAGEAAAQDALSQARADLTASIRLSEQNTLAAIKAAAAPPADSGLMALLRSILEKVTTPAAPAPASPTAPTAPTGPRPSREEIRAWEQGINLPEGWGFFFVDNFGRLPANIPELDRWRAEKAIPTAGGGWCIHWGGELKCI